VQFRTASSGWEVVVLWHWWPVPPKQFKVCLSWRCILPSCTTEHFWNCHSKNTFKNHPGLCEDEPWWTIEPYSTGDFVPNPSPPRVTSWSLNAPLQPSGC
jgi:hypothetical protein